MKNKFFNSILIVVIVVASLVFYQTALANVNLNTLGVNSPQLPRTGTSKGFFTIVVMTGTLFGIMVFSDRVLGIFKRKN